MPLPDPALNPCARHLFAATGLLLALAATAAPTASLPPGVERVAAVEGITEYRLANGLQVLLYPDAAKPTVTVNVTYKVGSRMENYGETGMAHLLEHLMFKGSTHYPQPTKDYSARGFDFNGSTSYDRTNYHQTFPAGEDNLRYSLSQQADAMTHSFIARRDLDSEMTVVRNEFEMGENRPSSVLEERLFAVMFDWHAYGRSIIGDRSDIENVGIPNLQAFYRMYYQPDNAVLIVAGHFDPAPTLHRIADTFGRIPKPRRTLPPQWTVEPAQDGERSVVVRRKSDTQLVYVGYHVPAGRSREAAAIEVAAAVLGDGPNARLHHELVETGLASSVFSDTNLLHDTGALVFGAVVKPGDPLDKVRDRLVEVVEHSLIDTPATAAELERVQRDNETAAERTLADPQAFGVELSEYIAQGDWRLFFVDRDAIPRVDAAAVATALGHYLLRDNRTVAEFIPEDHPRRAEVPAPLSAAEMLRDFVPRPVAAAGESFDPGQDNIDARTHRFEAGNLRIALLPKKTHGQTVDVAMDFHFGDLESLRGHAFTRSIASQLLTAGTPTMTRQQIADEMTRLKMNGGPLDFVASRDTLAQALRLSARLLRESSFPDTEFDQFKRRYLTSLESQLTDPNERSRDALLIRFDPYPAPDPRHYLSLSERMERMKALTAAEVREFHHRFWGTARGEIAVVGDFDEAAIRPLLPELFAGWASPAPYAEVLREPHEVPAQRGFIDTPDKEGAVYRARLALDLRDDDADAPALMLADLLFGGGGGLHSRLGDRVRQKDGLSYGIGSGLTLSGRERAGFWGIGAIAAPQNINHVEADVQEELARMLKDGFTPAELEEGKRNFLQSRLLARSDDGTLAAGWVENLHLGRSFTFSKELERKVAALTPEQVLQTLRRRIDPAQLSVEVAGDARKGAH